MQQWELQDPQFNSQPAWVPVAPGVGKRVRAQ